MTFPARVLLVVASLLLGCEAATDPTVPDDPAPAPRASEPAAPARKDMPTTPETPRLLRRVALVGASATYGFGARFAPSEAGGVYSKACGLHDVFEATLAQSGGERSQQCADLMFFLNPTRVGPNLVGQAIRAGATLVIGVDFLFWYGYGTTGAGGDRLVDEIGRLALLEEGLKQLDRFECSIVVGDFPDMSPAVGIMIAAAQMPAPDTLAALNTRVHAWADARPHVLVLPLAKVIDDMRADRRLVIGDHVWPAGSTRVLLQRDQLHPTIEGQVALVLLVIDTLMQGSSAIGADDFVAEIFDLNVQRILERLQKTLRPLDHEIREGTRDDGT